jgi:hypothetical protein
MFTPVNSISPKGVNTFFGFYYKLAMWQAATRKPPERRPNSFSLIFT